MLGDRLGHDRQLATDFEARRSEVLAALPRRAARALALGQVGELERAEQEIRKLAGRASPELMVGLIALAESLDLPAAQMRLAQSLRSEPRATMHFGALYPLPSWQPVDGYTVDRALIYAIMRAESAFDPTRREPRRRARPDAGDARDRASTSPAAPRSSRRARTSCSSPRPRSASVRPISSTSCSGSPIGGNLIFVAAAYNAGPGRVARWQERLGIENDPLLFLESIPIRETREYVKKVLTNLWSYRARLGQPQPALEALARNEWPTYRALDARAAACHAWN